jgi:hypothetical protein
MWRWRRGRREWRKKNERSWGWGGALERWAMRGGLCKIACGRFYAKMMKISKFLFFASK